MQVPDVPTLVAVTVVALVKTTVGSKLGRINAIVLHEKPARTTADLEVVTEVIVAVFEVLDAAIVIVPVCTESTSAVLNSTTVPLTVVDPVEMPLVAVTVVALVSER